MSEKVGRTNIKLSENDQNLRDAFDALIKFYWAKSEDVPARLKLMCMLNNWPNAAIACHEIPKLVSNKSLVKQMNQCVVMTQSRVGGQL